MKKEMKNEFYVSPEVEIVKVAVEAGIAASDVLPGEDGDA